MIGHTSEFRRTGIYPWILVALLWGVALLNYMDRQMLSTMKDAMAVDITELESATNFGRLMAMFLWIYGLMSPLSGVIADRVSRKWLIISSLFVWSAVTLMMGFCETFTQIYWLRALMGVSEALYIPAGLSLIADWHTEKTRSIAVGIHMTGLYTGQALGGFGATIAGAYSWHMVFLCFGGVGVAYALLLIFFLKDIGRGVTSPETVRTTFPEKLRSLAGGIGMVLGNISFWVILLIFATPSLPGWATKNWLPTLFAENLSIDMTVAGPMSTFIIAGASFFGVIIGGMLSDRWVQRNLKGRIYTSSIGLGLMIPSLMFLGFGHTVATIAGGGILFGIGYGFFDANNMPVLCQFIPSRNRATAYGIMNMTGVFAGAAITGYLGRSVDAGHLGRDFALLAAVVAAALLIQITFLKPKAIDKK